MNPTATAEGEASLEARSGLLGLHVVPTTRWLVNALCIGSPLRAFAEPISFRACRGIHPAVRPGAPARESGRQTILLLCASLFLAGCTGGSNADAGPTVGTFQVEISGGAGGVPPGFGATSGDGATGSLHAIGYRAAPAQFLCGSGGLTEIIGVTGVYRAYVRLPQYPPVEGALALVDDACGVYFTVASNPGLPLEQSWAATSGTLTVSAVNGASFTITIANAAMSPSAGSTGSFTANATMVVVNAQGI